MNRKNNKKGFTIVELVIVIAVIGILAAVLIPTFSNLVTTANDSSAMQTANADYKNYLITHDYKETNLEDLNGYVVVNNRYFEIEAGQFLSEKLDAAPYKTECVTAVGGEFDNIFFVSCNHTDAEHHTTPAN